MRIRFFPESDLLQLEHSSTDLSTETDTMLNCVSVLYNQKIPRTPSCSLIISWNMLPQPDTHTHTNTHGGFHTHMHPPPPTPAPPTQPERTGWESLWKPSPETWQGYQTFCLYLGQLPKIFLSLQKKRRASSGLEADRLRNINKIWSSDSFLERRGTDSCKENTAQFWKKKRGENSWREKRIVKERRGQNSWGEKRIVKERRE